MQTFTFNFDGQTVTAQADNAIAAMGIVNRQLPLGDGAWFPADQEDTFRWVEGNFFD